MGERLLKERERERVREKERGREGDDTGEGGRDSYTNVKSQLEPLCSKKTPG
jgi:hypothetical protein